MLEDKRGAVHLYELVCLIWREVKYVQTSSNMRRRIIVTIPKIKKFCEDVTIFII